MSGYVPMNVHPDYSHIARRWSELSPAVQAAALDWQQAIHEQDGALRLANLLQDLLEDAEEGYTGGADEEVVR